MRQEATIKNLKCRRTAAQVATVSLKRLQLFRGELNGALQRWPRSFEQIPKIYKWILRGQAALAEGPGSELKYTTSGVRACRDECGLRVL